MYDKNEFDNVLTNSKVMLVRLKEAVHQVENEFPESSETEKLQEIYKRAYMLKFLGNPLVATSIMACREI